MTVATTSDFTLDVPLGERVHRVHVHEALVVGPVNLRDLDPVDLVCDCDELPDEEKPCLLCEIERGVFDGPGWNACITLPEGLSDLERFALSAATRAALAARRGPVERTPRATHRAGCALVPWHHGCCDTRREGARVHALLAADRRGDPPCSLCGGLACQAPAVPS